MPLRIGFIASKDPLSEAVIEEINSRGRRARAGYCVVEEARIGRATGYQVIVDRLSHCYEFYRPYLKHAVMTGTYVINNPFWFSADDKFFNYSLASRLGVAVPRTVLLPSREYDERVLNASDLHNLRLPVDWEAVVNHVGLPAVLKPYDGYGWREVHRVDTLDELVALYDESQMDVMMLQEFIDFEHYVRCFVVGKRYVLPIRYNPVERRYLLDHRHLTASLGERVVEDCIRLNQALGYDLNTVEFAIREGVPYAIDFMNPVPQAHPEVITMEYFRWVVERLARVAIEYAESEAWSPFRMSSELPEARRPVPTYLPE